MAGAESSDFSAIIMLCDSVACPEGHPVAALQSDARPDPGIGVAVIVTVPYARAERAPRAIDGPGTVPGRARHPGGLNMVMASPLQGHR